MYLQIFAIYLYQAIRERTLIKTKKQMVQNVILTAIHFKGIYQVKTEVAELAQNCLCSESYIKNIIRKVEKGQLIIR